jgi:hypothetical protein
VTLPIVRQRIASERGDLLLTEESQLWSRMRESREQALRADTVSARQGVEQTRCPSLPRRPQGAWAIGPAPATGDHLPRRSESRMHSSTCSAEVTAPGHVAPGHGGSRGHGLGHSHHGVSHSHLCHGERPAGPDSAAALAAGETVFIIRRPRGHPEIPPPPRPWVDVESARGAACRPLRRF